MIPFYLVTGFLGSGKTTLLQHILREYSGDKRIAIIQNEFAPSGTDGKVLEMEDKAFKLVEVNNGSVFCVCMLASFLKSLKNVVENYQPEMIFLEASGLADPINILELLQEESIRGMLRLVGIFCIVDAPNFEKGLNKINRFRHQVMIADYLLLNKTDLFSGDLAVLQDKIRQMNPYAEIIQTEYCDLDLQEYISTGQLDHRAAMEFGKKVSEGRPAMRACVLRIHEKITKAGINTFVDELKKDCPRIKGFVNATDSKVYSIQLVFDHLEIKEIQSYHGPTEIVAFGEKISPGELRRTFLKHT